MDEDVNHIDEDVNHIHQTSEEWQRLLHRHQLTSLKIKQ